ncbi:phosphatidyl synthase [Penicillium argentinense]|uniref:Phosphatidyl synthase n=1 Tax=Penicillium argentinense TaxID=1131581 RepID=A0A9W9FNV2_9EURO|nr:phosphatidyl synthase [Penicillium argentinense]KAJ5103372.1 phosphatidyl synthase [Penicillium argentinense]
MTTADGLGAQRVRRLSSLNADRADLYRGPNVIVPPKHLMTTNCSGNSSSNNRLIMNNQPFDEVTSSGEETPQIATPLTPPMVTSADFAFVFDIDGVLLRGGKPIPEAVQAMKYINGENPWGVTVPYVFLTNGGGKTEAERCLDLSRQLELDVHPGQFICGHTPMREMAERYNTVLVVGGEGEKCRIVAEEYGFKNVITPGDIIKTKQDTTPFRKLTEEEYKNSRFVDLENTQIEAVFVFADSRDWAGDQQIIMDTLMTVEGKLNKRSEVYNEGPPCFFSHNDLIWSTSHDYSRIGMGALKTSLEAVYKAVTGKDLNTFAFGKPQMGTFQFATRLLQEWRQKSHDIADPPSTVYFIGDTPESDIRGTNEFNKQSDIDWYSILVKTGVWQEGTIPRYPPRKICDNVYDAIKFAVEREQQKLINHGDTLANIKINQSELKN